MAKRTSFDQKAKGVHKSRKKIIDTVFGREDNNQRVFGYEGEVVKKHKVGETWTDKDGKEWEQKDGYIVSVSKFDDIRNYLNEITTCSNKNCKTIQYASADKKLIAKTGKCLYCTQKEEQVLRDDGTWPFYEDYKISKNKLSVVLELQQKYEEAYKDISNQMQMVNEDGTIQNWTWDIDIEKVKEDIKKDMEGATEAVSLLLERISLLEDKLKELGHSELIK
jgi:hypothetical protein